MELVLGILYLALPAFVANMMPVVAARMKFLPQLAIPVDRGQMVRGVRLLGDNKTWRGVLAAVVGAVLVVLIQYGITVLVVDIAVTLAHITFIVGYGAYVGLLVMVGDALGSIIKRQFKYPSGAPCIPLDQIDYIVVFIVGTLVFIPWTFTTAGVLILITFFLNLVTNATAYVLGIKNTCW